MNEPYLIDWNCPKCSIVHTSMCYADQIANTNFPVIRTRQIDDVDTFTYTKVTLYNYFYWNKVEASFMCACGPVSIEIKEKE